MLYNALRTLSIEIAPLHCTSKIALTLVLIHVTQVYICFLYFCAIWDKIKWKLIGSEKLSQQEDIRTSSSYTTAIR